MDEYFPEAEGMADNKLVSRKTRSERSVRYVNGFRIGIYKTIAERMSEGLLDYKHKHIPIEEANRKWLPTIRFVDIRLSLRYDANFQTQNWISLLPLTVFPVRMHMTVLQTRYLVVVPRIVVRISTKPIIGIVGKFIAIAGLLLTILIFVTVRYFCQRITNANEQPESVVDTFLDTFSRSLGTTA